ncbi:polysaccharide deacetylase family protein [Candidatus Saccharibacteria bacterium]|nr:polysaccharide deacetylase family protein [Candidatus Saccharibacteria bacterium]
MRLVLEKLAKTVDGMRRWQVAIHCVSVVFVATLGVVAVLVLVLHENEAEREVFGTDSILIYSERYNVNARFPITENEEFNTGIAAAIEAEIAEFRASVDGFASTNFPYELNIGYRVYRSGNLASIRFTVLRFLGGAHATEQNWVFYYDKVERLGVEWEELFNDKMGTLERLSELAHVELMAQNLVVFNDSEVARGLEPRRENFELLVFDESGVRVILGIYQVAPRSTGVIELILGYEELNGFLNYPHTGEVESEVVAVLESSNERRLRDIEALRGRPVMMLTFDDGPGGATTARLLDELAKRDARATFFMLGERMERFPEIVVRVFLDGHTVAHHTFSHRDMRRMSNEEIWEERDRTNELLRRTLGVESSFLRPPYGSWDERVREVSGMTMIIWDVDPKDWRYRDAEVIYRHIVEYTREGSIVLAHDIHESTVDGVVRAMDELLARGYALISLEEAVELGLIRADGRVYWSMR